MECTIVIIQGESPDVSTQEQLTIILLFDKKVILERALTSANASLSRTELVLPNTGTEVLSGFG